MKIKFMAGCYMCVCIYIYISISVFLTQIICFIYGNDVQVQARFRKYTLHSIWVLLLFLLNLLKNLESIATSISFSPCFCLNNHVSLNNTTPSLILNASFT